MLTMAEAFAIDTHLYGRLCARRPRPAGIRDIPGQISEAESRGLYYLMKEEWSGTGNVLEIGTLFGFSTQAIGLGMRENPRFSSGLLVAIDGFGQYYPVPEFERLMEPWLSGSPDWPRILDDYRREGFEHAFHALHRDQPYAEFLRVRRALVPTRGAEVDGALARALAEGGEYSVAFIDSAKEWFPFRALLSALVPRLAEGALVLFQDYQWLDSFAIPVLTSALGAAFARRAVLDTTHVFEYRGGLTEADILASIPETPEEFGLDGIESVLRGIARDAYVLNDAQGLISATVQLAIAAAACHQPARGHELLTACAILPGVSTHRELLDAAWRKLSAVSVP